MCYTFFYLYKEKLYKKLYKNKEAGISNKIEEKN